MTRPAHSLLPETPRLETQTADPQPAGGRLYMVSGCSGSGKSTLIAALARQGEAVVVEPGREIVKAQLASDADGLPWANTQRFIDRCAERAIADFDRQLRLPQRTFFDRSFIDVASAVARSGLAAPAGLEAARRSKRYAPFVFISAPWEALFGPDSERRHTFRAALAEYDMLVPTYRRHGYEIVFIPPLPVAQRVAFVLSVVTQREAVGP